MPTTASAASPAPAELLYLLAGDPEDLAEHLATLHAADLVDGLRELPADAAAKVMTVLPFEAAVQVFDEPEFHRNRCRILERMENGPAAALIEGMSADRQADLFRELPEPHRGRLLGEVDEPTRQAMSLLLQYPSDTAGGIMTTEFVSVPATWTAGATLEYVRTVGRAKETIYAIYVVDADTRVLRRAVSLREVLQADAARPVDEIGDQRAPVTVRPLTDREEVARTISKYNLLAAPVLDEGGHVIGIVTVDDVIDAIVREQTEDVQKFGGMEALDEPYMRIPFLRMIRKRGGWLCALFLSEMLTATAMQRFEGEIEKAAVLAMFIPLVMSSGGNSGSQATSLIIRALALREIRLADWWRIAVRELPTGLTLGAILGVIGFTRIEIWQHFHLFNYGVHHLLLALTVGMALVGIVAFGSLAGSMLPFVLKRVGFDPASASAPFVATLVDVTGLVIYFSVAVLILRGTLL